MSQEDNFINGEALRLRRESRGLSLNDLAAQTCMSLKQIQQLEDGGMNAFYGIAVKLTAAKKVAELLGLSVDEVLVRPAPAPLPEMDASATPDGAQTLAVPMPLTDAKKSKAALWGIAALFLAAMAVAAYLQPQEESSDEPAPPLQIVPADAENAASDAELPAATAASAASHTTP